MKYIKLFEDFAFKFEPEDEDIVEMGKNVKIEKDQNSQFRLNEIKFLKECGFEITNNRATCLENDNIITIKKTMVEIGGGEYEDGIDTLRYEVNIKDNYEKMTGFKKFISKHLPIFSERIDKTYNNNITDEELILILKQLLKKLYMYLKNKDDIETKSSEIIKKIEQQYIKDDPFHEEDWTQFGKK